MAMAMAMAPQTSEPSALVHDVCYDHHGQRVATCSSDQMIRVFNARSGLKLAEWRAHSGSIHRLSWAHPEFGVALASCSFDRRVCVWEETTDSEEALLNSPRLTSWLKVAEISDAVDSIVDVAFAPHRMGVILASCGADGMVRVHEAADIIDLAKWELHSEIDVASAAADSAAEARDANAAAQHAMSGGERGGEGQLGGRGPLMSTARVGDKGDKGGGDKGGGGGGGGGGGPGGGGGDAGALGLSGGDGGGVEPMSISWSTSLIDRPMLLVGCSDGSIQLWAFEDETHTWTRSRAFERAAVYSGGVRPHLDCVRSVCWAADMGRSYQLIASGSRDRTVKLWALQRTPPEESGGGRAGGGEVGGEAGEWVATCAAELTHQSQVWRVSWNATGSMLATAEDNGTVRVFQKDANGSWRHAAPMPGIMPGIA